MLKNTAEEYGTISKFFHWLISPIVLILLAVGATLTYIPNTSTKYTIITIHKSFGLLVLALVILRFAWRLSERMPERPSHVPKFQYFLARVGHALLYFLLIAMPITGWTMSTAAGYIPNVFGLFHLPMPFIPSSKPLAQTANFMHYLFAWALFIMIIMHTSAALFHHFYYKDNILRRMLPFRTKIKHDEARTKN